MNRRRLVDSRVNVNSSGSDVILEKLFPPRNLWIYTVTRGGKARDRESNGRRRRGSEFGVSRFGCRFEGRAVLLSCVSCISKNDDVLLKARPELILAETRTCWRLRSPKTSAVHWNKSRASSGTSSRGPSSSMKRSSPRRQSKRPARSWPFLIRTRRSEAGMRRTPRP